MAFFSLLPFQYFIRSLYLLMGMKKPGVYAKCFSLECILDSVNVFL